jgi:hypothetical protein
MNSLSSLFQFPQSASRDYITVEIDQNSDTFISERSFDLEALLSLHSADDSLKKQFVSHNQSTFNQNYVSAEAFINDMCKASEFGSIYTKNVECNQFSYLYGIPVLIVSELPWNDPLDYIEYQGFFSNVGIICKKSNFLNSIVYHELGHAVNDWLKKIDVFILPGMKKLVNDDPLAFVFESILNFLDNKLTGLDLITRFRDEIIVLLMCNHGHLAPFCDQRLTRILLGVDSDRAKTLLSDEDWCYFLETLDRLKGLDTAIRDDKDRRINLCRLFLSEFDMEKLALSLKVFLND